MAVIDLISPVGEIRGTVGGVTFSRNNCSRYAKAWLKPTYKRTDSQSVVRNSMMNSTISWRSLTDGQRSAWVALGADPPEIDYDRFGNQIYLSGLQWYTRCNTRLLMAGCSQISDAPTQERPPTLTDVVLAVDESGSPQYKVLSFTEPTPIAGGRIVVFGAMTRSPSITAYLRSYKYLGAWDDFEVTQIDLTSVWGSTFPNGATGQKCFARAFIQDADGLRSLPADVSTVAT